MKITTDRTSISIDDVDLETHIVAGLSKGKIVLVSRQLHSIYSDDFTGAHAQIITAKDLKTSNGYGTANWSLQELVKSGAVREWHAFKTPKEFFEWAASVS